MKSIKLPNLEQELGVKFKHKPLLIGGLAMEFYGLRKSGKDVDFILSKTDHKKLKTKFQKEGMKQLKGKNRQSYKKKPVYVDLYGDHGILIREFEIWDNICGYDYDFSSEKAINKKHCKIISLEKLLFLKALATQKKKYLKDVRLIVKKIFEIKYGSK